MLKIATLIIAIVLAYAGLFCLANIITPRFMMGETINSLFGMATDKDKQIDVMKSLEFGQKIMGVIGLIIVIFGFIVLFIGFWRAKKWAWWTFLIASVISGIWALIYPLWGLIFQGLIVAFRSNTFYQAITLVIFLIGLSMPINSFFKKKNSETDKTESEISQSRG